MAQAKIYEGTSIELAEKLLSLPGSHTYRMTLTLDEPDEERSESLEAAIARMTSRTPDQIAAARERILSLTPAPRALPEGKTILDVIMGTWPGDETDDEINAALEKLS